MRQNPMTAAVSRQKINLPPVHFAADKRVRRLPERGVDIVFGRIAQLLHLIEAAATDDPDCWNVIFHPDTPDLIRKIDKMGSG